MFRLLWVASTAERPVEVNRITMLAERFELSLRPARPMTTSDHRHGAAGGDGRNQGSQNSPDQEREEAVARSRGVLVWRVVDLGQCLLEVGDRAADLDRPVDSSTRAAVRTCTSAERRLLGSWCSVPASSAACW